MVAVKISVTTKKKENATDYDIGHFPLQNAMHFYKSDLRNKAKNLMIISLMILSLIYSIGTHFQMKTRNLSLAVD